MDDTLIFYAFVLISFQLTLVALALAFLVLVAIVFRQRELASLLTGSLDKAISGIIRLSGRLISKPIEHSAANNKKSPKKEQADK